MKAERRAQVQWKGNLNEGVGRVTVGTGVLPPFDVSWPSRVEDPQGRTSPEELIAAAHASCFSMALSNEMDTRGSAPERLDVTAACTIEVGDSGANITTMRLTVRAEAPGMSREDFRQAVEAAKTGCPVSKALAGNVDIQVTSELV